METQNLINTYLSVRIFSVPAELAHLYISRFLSRDYKKQRFLVF